MYFSYGNTLKLHQQIIGLTTDPSLRGKFSIMAKEEESHVKTVGKILSRLTLMGY